MGIQQQPSNCGIMPADFLQLLASTLMVAEDGTVLGFNFVLSTVTQPCPCEPYINCDNNHLPAESVLRNAFTTDSCGNLAIKLVNCDGSAIYVEDGEPV